MTSDGEQTLPALEELVRTLPTASAVFDRDLRYRAYNHHWLEAYRLGDVDLIGRGHYDVFPEIGDEWRRIHQRCLAGAVVSKVADRFPRADGSVDFVDYTVAPWFDAAGRVGGLVMHTQVVTQRETLGRKLSEEQAFVRAFVDRSPVGLNLCRLDGTWLESNQAFLGIIGYTAEEAAGNLTYWDLTPAEYNEAEQAQLEALRTTGRYGPYEKEFVRKDGSRIPVRLNGCLIERDGEQFIWSLIEDLSDKRRLEQQLRDEQLRSLQTAKLASIGELAAGIAHEINNPLQVIEACAFELLEGASSEQAKEIRLACDRAARIVRGLRKFAREDVGVVAVHAVPELVDEVLAMTASRIKHYGVALEVDLGGVRGVRCAALELGQILINLLNNALDAVRGRDDATIWLRVDQRDGAIRFAVLDNGPGVPAELAERMFEPFVTTKPPGEGTGLGLSISYSLAKSMGGALGYERRDGQSCFTVSLPAMEAPS